MPSAVLAYLMALCDAALMLRFLQIEDKTLHRQNDCDLLLIHALYGGGLEPNLSTSEVCLY